MGKWGKERVLSARWEDAGHFGHAKCVFALVTAIAAAAWCGIGSQPALARSFAPAPTPSFGEEGAAAGQFKSPSGIAVDASGDLLVVDSHDRRVEKWQPGSEGGATFLYEFGGSDTPPPEFEEEPLGVGIDDGTTGPTAGDVYVAVYHEGKAVVSPIDEFRPKLADENEYEYVCQLTGPGSGCLPDPAGEGGGSSTPFKEARDATLDSAGDLYIAAGNAVYELPAGGTEVVLLHEFAFFVGSLAVLGDDLYATTPNDEFDGSLVELEVEPATHTVSGETVLDEKGSTAVAVAPGGNVYVVNGEGAGPVEVFNAAGESTGEAFAAGKLGEAHGVAYDPLTEDVYVSSEQEDLVHVFEPVELPVANTEAAKEVTAEAAVLTGTVNPEGEEGTRYYFGWGEGSIEEHETPVTALATGTAPVSVEAELNGLKPHHTYRYELFAYNDHDEAPAEHVAGGILEVETAPSPPEITGTSVSEVFAGEATLDAQIDPEGEATTYRFEYGQTEAYGEHTPEANAGEGEATVAVASAISGLAPETTYHFRVVATNATGTSYGPDRTLTTYAATSAFALPDGRAYEQVSPTDAGIDALGELNQILSAPSGEAVTYLSTGPFPGVEGAPALMTYLAQRGAEGWSSAGLLPRTTSPDSTGTELRGITENLAYTIVQNNDRPALAEGGEAGHYDLYLRDSADGSYSLFANTGISEVNGNVPETSFAGSSADDSRIFFETSAQLASAAPPGVHSLYEWHKGTIQLAGVLPDGQAPAQGTAAGIGFESDTQNDYAISREGTRVFFSDLGTNEIYLRENGERTVLVSGLVANKPAVFRGASPSGSAAFFTLEGDLYRFATEGGHVSDLTPGGQVQGVVGIGGEGTYVYFVAQGVLAGNENSYGAKALAGEDNLYLWHEGEPTRFIARLSNGVDYGAGGPNTDESDWKEAGSVPGEAKGGRVSADGKRLLFVSHNQLTRYENPRFDAEIYLYDAESGNFACVSCNPSGAPAKYSAALYTRQPQPAHSVKPLPLFFPRNLSENGKRVFFQTEERLLPQDKDGEPNVYEWEEASEGSCPGSHAQGCLYLISTGESRYPSYFGEASANGDNVFFFTRQKLVGQDLGEDQVLYDARVGGGIASQNPPATPPPCDGEACLGAPSTTSGLGPPASGSLGGPGNLKPSRKSKGAKPKTLTRKQRLVRALRACHKKRKRKRDTCEREARKRYAAKASHSTKKRNGSKHAGGARR